MKAKRRNESADIMDEVIEKKMKEFPHVAFAGENRERKKNYKIDEGMNVI